MSNKLHVDPRVLLMHLIRTVVAIKILKAGAIILFENSNLWHDSVQDAVADIGTFNNAIYISLV